MTLSSTPSAMPLPQVDSVRFAQEGVLLANGIAGELVRFGSRNPDDFGTMLSGRLGPTVKLSA